MPRWNRSDRLSFTPAYVPATNRVPILLSQQVLALGLSRDVTNWAVEWLVAVCGSVPAVCGSVSWTLDAANTRAQFFGRRSAVSTVAPG